MNILYKLLAVLLVSCICGDCLAVDGLAPRGTVVRFQPSLGRYFGGEVLRNKSPNVINALSSLEKLASQKGRMLSRSEILLALDALELKFTEGELSMISHAVIVVQKPEVKLNEILNLYESSLGAVKEISATTTIKSSKGTMSPAGYRIPSHSVYSWCLRPNGASILLHDDGEVWMSLPLKAVVSSLSTIIAGPKGDSQVQSVYRLSGTYRKYVYPEWHPLVSARISPNLERRSVFTFPHGKEVLTGHRFFNGLLFGERESFNGVDCYVFGNLSRAVYIDASDLRRVVGEVHGYSLYEFDGEKMGLRMLFSRVDSYARINEIVEETSGVLVPTLTKIMVKGNKRPLETIEISTQVSNDGCELSDGFERFEPYFLVDEIENTSGTVGGTRKQQTR